MVKGIITPVITVFDNEGNIDFKGNEAVINHLIRGGVNGLLFLGSIGEFFAMTMEEKKDIIKFAVKTVDKRVPVFVGTGGTVVDEVVELTKFAESEGADGVVVISPYYFKLDNDNLYRYYAEVASNTNIPVILYNFPDRTSISLDPELVLRLAKDFKNIAGIKDTVDSINHTRKLIQTVKAEVKDFAVYSGYDEYFISNLMAGGDGLIGGLSNVVPDLFAKIYRAYKEKDFDTVLQLQGKICTLMGIYDVSQPFVAGIKMAVKLAGVDIDTQVKKPSEKVTQVQADKIRLILQNAGIGMK